MLTARCLIRNLFGFFFLRRTRNIQEGRNKSLVYISHQQSSVERAEGAVLFVSEMLGGRGGNRMSKPPPSHTQYCHLPYYFLLTLAAFLVASVRHRFLFRLLLIPSKRILPKFYRPIPSSPSQDALCSIFFPLLLVLSTGSVVWIWMVMVSCPCTNQSTFTQNKLPKWKLLAQRRWCLKTAFVRYNLRQQRSLLRL